MFNFIFYSKKNLFFLIGFLALLFILFALQLFSTPQQPQPTQNPSPSLSPSFQPQNNLPPFTTPDEIPPGSYQPDKLNQDYQRIINKQPVSGSDQTIRNNLTNSVGNQTGIIQESSDFKIEYIKAPDAFMIEILSNNTESAKANAQSWLKQQGLSDSGICNLPIVFYLSRAVNSYFINNNIQFDPLPKGCQ